MRHWLQIATRNWLTRPARTGLAVLATALGVGIVVWVTCCYESVNRSVTALVLEWIGHSHVIIEPVEGRWAVFHDDVERQVAAMPAVRQVTTRTREFVRAAAAPAGAALAPAWERLVQIEAMGIVVEKERAFRDYRLSAGRFFEPGRVDEVLAERLLAEEWGFGVGDVLWIADDDPSEDIRPFRVVGLVNRRRASANQAPMIWLPVAQVQAICRLPQRIKAVDIILHDRSVASIRGTVEDIRAMIQRRDAERQAAGLPAESLKITSTEAQHKRLGAAQGLLQFMMMLLSCVVLLTGFFIIMATMNMGIVERIRELGLLRCVGLTRFQLCAQVLGESVPLGLAGIIVGVPLGFALQWITIRMVPQYVGEMVVSRWGLMLAIGGGLATILIGSAAPAARATLVSPVEATRPLAGVRRFGWAWAAAALGAACLAVHEYVKHRLSLDLAESFDAGAVAALVLLYFAFALFMPLAVVLFGRVAVLVGGLVLRLRPELLGDEIDKSPFRSAALCSGLMVGLSMIVALVVWGDSVKRGWQFPKEFPEAILYAYNGVPYEKAAALKDIPELAEFSASVDFPFTLKKPSSDSWWESLTSVLEKTYRFIAIDPDSAFDVVKLTYIEGDEREAVAKLRQGGHLLVTREFTEAKNLHVGDQLTLWADDPDGKPRRGRFTIAGVISSPGLDIAISFFNATEYYQFYAVGAVVGSRDDAKRLFGRDRATLMFFNFRLPDSASVAESQSGRSSAFAPTQPAAGSQALASASVDRDSDEGHAVGMANPTASIGGGPIPGDGPEERVANQMLERLDWPNRAFVTARQLKRQINRSIDDVTLLLSAIPLVGLLVAALGMANLMTANVASRQRQIAVIRAIGATRSQVLRMVIGEALVLSLIGSCLGLALGIYLGHTSNFMTELLTGYRPTFSVPWHLVGVGAGLATLMCIAAAAVPARVAGRSNIVAALSAN